MAFHRCSIRHEDGSLVVEGVEISVEMSAGRDGAAEWHGTISVTHLIPLEAGKRYRLTLDDGRTGDFMVRRNTFAGGDRRAVAIHGAGPLK
jgi:hypothetical protein